MLFNAQGCTVWILCQFWCFQVNMYTYCSPNHTTNSETINFSRFFLFSYELLTTCFHEFPKFQTYWTRTQFFCQIAALHSSVSCLFTFSKSADCLLLSFRLYGDDALDNALNSFVKLLLSIPQSDLLVSFYFKLKSANVWFSILWNLTKFELIHSFF